MTDHPTVPDSLVMKGREVRVQAVYRVCEALERADISYVFLRGFEHLPDKIDNDADFLFKRGDRGRAVDTVRKALHDFGWNEVKNLEFSPISVTYAHGDLEDSVRLLVDYFEHIEWHFIPYMDPNSLISYAQRVDSYWVPSLAEQTFMNLTTRLLYTGKVREKHRGVDGLFACREESSRFRALASESLGDKASDVFCELVQTESWGELEQRAAFFRKAVICHSCLRKPWGVLLGMGRYLRRSLKRLVKPPGFFVVFEGADGVGKSTVIRESMDVLPNVLNLKEPSLFHWKPKKGGFTNSTQPNNPVDPRGAARRGKLMSLLYLAYHWIGFWGGWLLEVYPRLSRNNLVLGDRYIYDMYFDPERFRLDLPGWLLELITRFTPRPNLVIAMVASPKVIHDRKQELSVDEIAMYQEKLANFCNEREWCTLLDANESIDSVRSNLVSLVCASGEK
ncbi:hypothetical protein Rhal01_02853 [Rubritalea halochordaticola]|uniref:Thymidylate kinase-like domain-containing protein n=1 Tax=Rubritalea halochordaticola TaxID=714537 RepID=A0ABP9V1V3_9BACT